MLGKKNHTPFRVITIIFLILSSFLVLSCEIFFPFGTSTGATSGGNGTTVEDDSDTDSDNDPDPIVLPGVGPGSFFWGRWVRMDGSNDEWYMASDGIETGAGSRSSVSNVSETSFNYAGQLINKQTDNILEVTPGGEAQTYYLFRRSGATAEASMTINGIEDVSTLSVSRGFNLSGLGGVQIIMNNIENPGNTQTLTTNTDGSLDLDEVIVGDEYEITIPEQVGIDEEIDLIVSPVYDGEDLGIVNLTETDQNFKVSYTIANQPEYLLGGESYSLTIHLQNIGSAPLASADYDITETDGIVLSGDRLENILASVPANDEFTLDFILQLPDFDESEKIFEIPVSIVSHDGSGRWDDMVSIKAYREEMTIYLRSSSYEVQGVLISPDRKSTAFKVENMEGSITIPVRDLPYVLALSGADYTTETRYSIGVETRPDTDGSELRTTSMNEPNNNETQTTPLYKTQTEPGFLGVYDLDFYSIYSIEPAVSNNAVITGQTPYDGASISDTYNTLSWDAVREAVRYEFRSSTVLDDLEDAEVRSLLQTSYTPGAPWTNLETNFWQVRGLDMDGNSTPWSEPSAINCNWGNMSGLSPSGNQTIYEFSPQFSWSAVAGAVSYDFRMATSTEALTTSDDIVVNTTNYTPVQSLANLTKYYWEVRAEDSDGQKGAWSYVYSVKPVVLNVGDTGPAGGYIYSVDPSSYSGRYMEIMAGHISTGSYGGSAVTLCSNYEVNGYSDWYLPSIEEWEVVYDVKASIPDLIQDGKYWAQGTRDNTVYYPYANVTSRKYFNMSNAYDGYGIIATDSYDYDLAIGAIRAIRNF
ncbi:MAG: hypothetical protein JEY99_18740 [Spirochaetales bacterium]|nr:hypothetical protein [Spirochaetales bacterium]